MPAQVEDAAALAQRYLPSIHGKAASPLRLNGTLSMRVPCKALNTEVILPWSEPAKNWDRRLDRHKPAVRVNGRNQG